MSLRPYYSLYSSAKDKEKVEPPRPLPPLASSEVDKRTCFATEPILGRYEENSDPWDPSFTNYRHSDSGETWFLHWTTDFHSEKLLQATDNVMSDLYLSRNSSAESPFVYVVNPSVWNVGGTFTSQKQCTANEKTWHIVSRPSDSLSADLFRMLDAPSITFLHAGVAALAYKGLRSGIAISEHRVAVPPEFAKLEDSWGYSFVSITAINDLQPYCARYVLLPWTGYDKSKQPDTTPLIAELQLLLDEIQAQAMSTIVVFSDVIKEDEHGCLPQASSTQCFGGGRVIGCCNFV